MFVKKQLDILMNNVYYNAHIQNVKYVNIFLNMV